MKARYLGHVVIYVMELTRSFVDRAPSMSRVMTPGIVMGMYLLVGGCGEGSTGCPWDFFAFEEDMEGWIPRGIDVDTWPVVDDWSILQSQDYAAGGRTSLQYFLNNMNDAGKIFIERSFVVDPLQPYRVSVQFAFGTPAWKFNANNWTIIAGVLSASPQTGNDLVPAFQGDADNGSDVDVGFKWAHKKYALTMQSDQNGLLYVVIGVWGTWESPRTHYVDNVCIGIMKDV